VAWRNVGENPTWTGALVPKFEPPPRPIPDVDLDFPESTKERIRLYYQQHPPDNGEDTSNMPSPRELD
jgi:hypothetical protein